MFLPKFETFECISYFYSGCTRYYTPKTLLLCCEDVGDLSILLLLVTLFLGIVLTYKMVHPHRYEC